MCKLLYPEDFPVVWQCTDTGDSFYICWMFDTCLPQVQPSSESSCSDLSLYLSRSQSGKTSKKPRGLEIMPTLLVSSSDLSPLNLSSPSLPTASLTPAFLQVSILPPSQVFDLLPVFWLQVTKSSQCCITCDCVLSPFFCRTYGGFLRGLSRHLAATILSSTLFFFSSIFFNTTQYATIALKSAAPSELYNSQ